ncbi:hypothetical protein EUGRSUZ_C01573 [Eucalyptus grandis]|uniref:Uncharacterized protein n=2 Tax=Eucalyptus grandis TaxID=71139 RepID=A0ACC3LDU4_EUCGR|nr:hypothetical protein EUGRSUZ_C01573 [Eucalyptus grandis]
MCQLPTSPLKSIAFLDRISIVRRDPLLYYYQCIRKECQDPFHKFQHGNQKMIKAQNVRCTITHESPSCYYFSAMQYYHKKRL